jgi:hypothetical protein
VPSRAKSTRSGTLLVRRISNPFEVIEQIIYLLFLRRLDDLHTLQENKGIRSSLWVTHRD